MNITSKESAAEFLDELKSKIRLHPSVDHRFFREFGEKHLSREQVHRFAVQWFKAAERLKIAFPALICNSVDDDTRFELIDVLYEEYGSGNREAIHATMLKKFLAGLGISGEEAEAAPSLKSIERFFVEVQRLWRDAHPAVAFGSHFSMETAAANVHDHFARGIDQYPYIVEKSYFTLHKTAEVRHSSSAEDGFLRFAVDPQNRVLLQQGAVQGLDLLLDMWEALYRHVFEGAPDA